MKALTRLILVSASLLLMCPQLQANQEQPKSQAGMDRGDPYIQGRTLIEAEAEAFKAMEGASNDDNLRYRLGAIRLVRAVERLAQNGYRYGTRPPLELRFLLQSIVPSVAGNPNPEVIDYPAFRHVFETFVQDLALAEKTLAEIKDPNVSLPVHLGLIRLDVDGDGKTTDSESLANIAPGLFGPRGASPDQESQWSIRFDRADVCWMRAYCHFLMALSEMMLAYDGQELFDCTAHLLFDKTKSPYPFLAEQATPELVSSYRAILDAIAGVHLIRLPVKEPERLKSALTHLESMIALSREMWPLAQAETDNDHEWMPNPNQTSVMPNSPMSAEQIQGWLAFLDESQALLEGRKLIPFWRGQKPLGVNLRRAFLEPTPFDLVLWIQGSAAAPYLEEGPMTTGDTWLRFQAIFRGQFVGYAFWIN